MVGRGGAAGHVFNEQQVCYIMIIFTHMFNDYSQDN